MPFRVTTLSMTAQALRTARAHTTLIAKYQEQLTTGLRINRPSDDPVDMRALLAHRRDLDQYAAEINNITAARMKLNSSVTRLLEAKDIFVAAKSLALESPGTFERDILADQVDQLLERLLQVANTQLDDEYLFSGTSTATRPFATSESGGGFAVDYLGGSQRHSIVVGIGLSVDAIYSGSEIFFGQERLATTFSGGTGAQAGAGTDSGIGRSELLVTHSDTSYLGPAGVQAGTSAGAGDTIIGPAGTHLLVVEDVSGDGSAGTVTLNGGPPVNWTSGDTDLQVTGPNGEVVYLDTTNIQAGFDGKVEALATGNLSFDEGVTVTAIDFSDNLAVVHGETGKVTHVDTSGIRSVGTERVNHPGTADVFAVLHQLAEDLRVANDLSDSEWQFLANEAIGELDRFASHLLDVVGEQASTLENLDAIELRNEDVQLELQRIITKIEAADVSEAVINLQTEQTLLQYTYATTSRLFELNLLNYI